MTKDYYKQNLFDLEPTAKPQGPVECLGMTFENDEKRREYFLEKLREKLKDPEFRKIEGFPIGEDEDILALSDPPYYTACPNPFIEDFIKHYGKPYDPETDDYRREPFAADVSEGKSDAIYNVHSYHTKVPYKAIMRYILHYTAPGDIVFDGFCGTGMTGIAAQLCGDKASIQSLGYYIESDGAISQQVHETGGKTSLVSFAQVGARHAVLSDLSPAATFISYNLNVPFDIKRFEEVAKRILKEVEQDLGWMYETTHVDGKRKGTINYTIWSEICSCSECGGEIVFMDAVLDPETRKVQDEFPCPHCHATLTKSDLELRYETQFDKALRKTVKTPKRVPTLINYSVGKTRYEKKPDDKDRRLLQKIFDQPLPQEIPTSELPDMQMTRVGRMQPSAITHMHQFFFPRVQQILAAFWRKAAEVADARLRSAIMFWIDSHFVNLSVRNRFRPNVSFPYNPLTGVFYIPQIVSEASVFTAYKNKLKRIISAFSGYSPREAASWIETVSATNLRIPDSSIDYIFTDPPFGENIYYSDLNFFAETWFGVLTNVEPEAIVDRVKSKKLYDYQLLMQRCFKEYYRILKPGRWMTVEFHNSKNSVWNAIQEALQSAGFVIADVRTLDKKQGSFQQVTSASAVKQDLIISAYKPNGGLEDRFKLNAGTEEGVWDFVRTHLKQLPIFVSKDGKAEVIAERQNYLLFDRMVAFHVQRGVTVPLSASEFYAGLEKRFPPRDGMYFLPDQAAEYDKKRMTVKEVLQLQLFVSDEASAIQWLKQLLTKKPQTFQDIHPQFLKEISGWQKHEKPLELSELLEQNFLRYDGKGEVPSQIHSYLSSNFKELRNLPKDAPALRAKAKDRWYVPDPNKAGDLEKLRERTLLREFEEYRESKQKRLKVFRLEAVRAGFKKAWQERDYATIIAVARKIPEKILQEDPKLLMWYDQAVTRMGGN